MKIGRQKDEIVGKSQLELPTIGPSGKQARFLEPVCPCCFKLNVSYPLIGARLGCYQNHADNGMMTSKEGR